MNKVNFVKHREGKGVIVVCSATDICVGMIITGTNNKCRYFQDYEDYPLTAEMLREIADYLDYLPSLH